MRGYDPSWGSNLDSLNFSGEILVWTLPGVVNRYRANIPYLSKRSLLRHYHPQLESDASCGANNEHGTERCTADIGAKSNLNFRCPPPRLKTLGRWWRRCRPLALAVYLSFMIIHITWRAERGLTRFGTPLIKGQPFAIRPLRHL